MMGLDAGYAKTGITVFHVTKRGDFLVEARTLSKQDSEAERAMERDILAIYSMADQLDAVLSEFMPVALFAELPHGGAQSARACRCMSLATATVVTLLRYHKDVAYELYDPMTVEKTLGIWLNPKDKEGAGIKKGQLRAWKKERIRETVIREWPEFSAWPKTKATAEDAYDSAAAFMCGRETNDLYHHFRARL